MDNIFEVEFTDHPHQNATVLKAQDRLQVEARYMVNHERAILDGMIRPGYDSGTIDQRLDALRSRRLDTDLFTTETGERHRKARRNVLAGGLFFLAIPAFGLLKPAEMYLAASGDSGLFGYNTTFLMFVGLLATAMLLGAKSAMLTFEPWLTKRARSFNTQAIDRPQIRIPIRSYWRVVLIDGETGQFRWPRLRQYYRCLPVTNEDIRAAALEHLYALEVRRMMSA